MSGTTVSDDPVRSAADLIWRAWNDGRVMRGLPPGCRPADRSAGYAIQAALADHSAHPPVGWKIAATNPAGQRHINVDGPIAGRLLAEKMHAVGQVLPFGANRMRVAEPEFAFRFAAALPPRPDGAVYDIETVLAAVGSLHPAIEVPDSRFTDFTAVGAAQLIADNACAHDFVLGPAAPDGWTALDLAAHPVAAVRRRDDGLLERTGSGGNVLGDPRAALCWLVNEVTASGVALDAGQIVTTGTCLDPIPIQPGDTVSADFGTIGRIEVVFADR